MTGGTDHGFGLACVYVGRLGLMAPGKRQQGQGIDPLWHRFLLEMNNRDRLLASTSRRRYKE
jgi:hypothetical protein